MALVFLESAGESPLEKFTGTLTGQTTIGVGKPLCIEIMHFYSGDAPKKMLGGDKSALIVSGFRKGLFAIDASPRFLNFWKDKVGDNETVGYSIFEESTRLVYYSPAMDEDTIDIEVEVQFNKVDQGAFGQIESLAKTAAGIPLFVGASGALIAGAGLLKLAGKLAAALEDKSPFLSDKLTLNFVNDDQTLNINQFPVCCRDEDEQIFKDYQVVLEKNVKGLDEAKLVHKETGKAYTGSKPYLLLQVSGAKRTANGEFTPRVMSAAMLDRFYGTGKKDQAMSILLDSTKLFNDMNFANKIRDVKKRLKGLKSGTAAFEKLSAQIKAYEQNILTEDYQNLLKIK